MSSSSSRSGKSVTVREVAQRAGVSPITVSRTFSGSHPVASETRQRVLQAAEELSYAPDLLAQALARKQSTIIGVMVLELSNPFFAPIIDAAQAVAQQRGYLVIISQSGRQAELERANLNQLRQMRAAGVLVTPTSGDLSPLRGLRARGTPVVLVSRRWEDGDFVAIDEHEGGRLVAEHLLALGHRRLACVVLDEPQNAAHRDRIEGFSQALARAGVEPPQILLTPTQRLQDGLDAADRLLALARPPTAAFVIADRMAIGVTHRLRARGVQVPGDVAVVGYDDIRYAEFLEVPLTTVALDKHEIGQRAAQILFQRIEADESDQDVCPQQVLLQPRLIVRASCGGNGAGGADR